jgi:hypothetical protein
MQPVWPVNVPEAPALCFVDCVTALQALAQGVNTAAADLKTSKLPGLITAIDSFVTQVCVGTSKVFGVFDQALPGRRATQKTSSISLRWQDLTAGNREPYQSICTLLVHIPRDMSPKEDSVVTTHQRGKCPLVKAWVTASQRHWYLAAQCLAAHRLQCVAFLSALQYGAVEPKISGLLNKLMFINTTVMELSAGIQTAYVSLQSAKASMVSVVHLCAPVKLCQAKACARVQPLQQTAMPSLPTLATVTWCHVADSNDMPTSTALKCLIALLRFSTPHSAHHVYMC